MTNFLSTVTNTARTVRQVSSAVAGTVHAVVDGVHAVESLFGVGDGPLGFSSGFYDQLQPASWRGLEFAVLGTRVRAGRRKALHEYPFRDGVWIEDIGKRGRVYGFEGFLIGDDVGDQIKAFVASIEKAGAGPLVHPTFGATSCEVIDFEAGEEWNAGRVWRFRIEFLEPVARGLELQPAAARDTVNQVNRAADGAEAATSGSFLDKVKAGLGQGIAAIQRVKAAVQPFVNTAIRLVGDASRVVNIVNNLRGSFGRYGSRHTGRSSGTQDVLTTVRQVKSAVTSVTSAASSVQANVLRTGRDLSSLVDLF